MKSKLFLFVLILSGCIIHKTQYDEVRETPKQKLIPPGTVWLRDNLFMDKTEIRNLDYLEFLYWTAHKNPENYKSLLPDSTCWTDSTRASGAYVEYYLRHPAYRDYPVVGVSYAQTVEFCKWRTDRVNEFIWIEEHRKTINYNPDSTYPHPEVVRYRLPSKEEWEYAAAAGLNGYNCPYGYESLIGKEKIPVSVTKDYYTLFVRPVHYIRNCDGGNSWQNEVEAIPGVVDFGTPNKYGIYNMTGNVSEIIADSLFKGFNYSTNLDGSTFLNNKNYIRADSLKTPGNGYTFRYNGTKAWLGFRCIAEVKN